MGLLLTVELLVVVSLDLSAVVLFTAVLLDVVVALFGSLYVEDLIALAEDALLIVPLLYVL